MVVPEGAAPVPLEGRPFEEIDGVVIFQTSFSWLLKIKQVLFDWCSSNG
jgi:hypothetical protein